MICALLAGAILVFIVFAVIVNVISAATWED